MCPQAHAQTWIVEVFAETLQEIDNAPIKAVLTSLFRLYAVHGITQTFGDFIEVCGGGSSCESLVTLLKS